MNTALDNRQEPLRDCAYNQLETTNSALQRIKATFKIWSWRSKVRSQLRKELLLMDVVRTEKDVGLTTGTLRQEAAKPFWKA